MDLDFDDEPAAPAARAGAKFKPRGRPQPKKKQVSVSTSQTTTLSTDVAKENLSTQSEHPVSIDASSTYPSDVSASETIVSPDGGITNQSNMGTISKENVSGGVSGLRACTNLNSEGKRCDDGKEGEPAYPDDPRRQDSATFGDFVTSETDEVINDQTQRMQTGDEEGECHWNMESLDIVQDEGITSTYEQHAGKFQPKPRLLDTVIEEPELHYSVDDTTGANQSEFMVNEESRNDEFNTDTTGYQEEEHNIPEVPREPAPGVLEQEHHVVSPSNNNTTIGEGEIQSNEAETRTDKKGKRKRGRKKKTTSEGEEPNKSPEKKKKFKHSSRRQKNRTLEKELLETPDDEIKHLPIRDMLRLVAYREWLEKKEAKGAPPVAPPTQESNTNASEDNQYYYQGFDAEDEFGMEEGENQENHVEVKPDSPVNYQTYMNKTPRTRWSKQDTQLFYEGIQEFGSNLSMVQQLFPERTHQQIKLKYKLEERKNPLKLDDALSTRSKELKLYHNVIKKLQQEAAAAKEGEEGDEEEEEAGEDAETTTDVPENEQQTKSEKTDERAGDGVAGVKESDGGDVENGVRSDGGDEFDENEGDDDDFWNSYKSEM